MRQYGAFEAKTHFSELLDIVAGGEKCVITKHGNKLALLIPFTADAIPSPAQDAVRMIKNLRKGIILGSKLSIKELRAEGRR